MRPTGPQDQRQMALYSAGFEFFAILAVCTGGGYALDVYLGSLPGFLLGGLAVGFGYGLWRLVRQARAASEPTTKKDRADG